MHYFAGHHQPGQQTTQSLRASQYKPSRKRKRDEDVEEPPITSGQDPIGSQATPNAQSQASFAPQEAAQLRVAGLLPGNAFEIPPPPFPHASVRISRDHFNYTNVQKELAGLHPSVFAVNATSKSQPLCRKSEKPALRQTHLGVLTTVLHHCLLEGDYQRAGRAWGMILRSQIAGRPIDVRNHDRWGIGAEILLRRSPLNQFTHGENDQESAQIPGNKQSSTDKDFYTERGFELAREYYERLIVQFPNRKLHPHRVDELTFYPAMFSLWIYEVCEKSKLRAQDSIVKMEELRQAREIKDRLDQLVISPPFDKRGDLLELRGMVGLWIGDLILGESFMTYGETDWGSDSGENKPTSQSIAERFKENTKGI
ncbi:uncharacterized protein BDR25DRAFT_331459 [Lindgomyces ingoldianus]|uniref:Uncharacterized protein n=1 Tax=Lindgomyces ingoldianus TaxID=673940 RepID=A0ACB6RBD4_9PLEO|nr:uncharacterized protein BDR25DRAFT_331459 [Lindgomyces ingoldianus]KAF2475642.1 hypothetical protein BDR25DRAFT_331459 [Lindgomyces ingoldianus]